MTTNAPSSTTGNLQPTKRSAELVGQSHPNSSKNSPAEKKLIVGQDICLAGEITACDTLVIEGRVEASLSDSRVIEVTETGVFKGKAEIDIARISGQFDGELTVREHLVIRSSGRVSGKIKYQQLAIESGGELVGTIEALPSTEPKKGVGDKTKN